MRALRSYGIASLIGHQAHTAWILLGAVVAVTVGFATLNLFLADSGLAVLSEHASSRDV
jgi:hypothetical protein